MKNFWNTQGEEERHQGSWGTLCEAQIVTCDSGRETSSQVSPINSGDTPEGGDMQNMAWITQRKTLQYNEPSLKYVSESLSGDSTVKTKDMTFICPSNYSTDQRVFPVQIYFQPIYRSSNYGNTKNIKLSKKKMDEWKTVRWSLEVFLPHLTHSSVSGGSSTLSQYLHEFYYCTLPALEKWHLYCLSSKTYILFFACHKYIKNTKRWCNKSWFLKKKISIFKTIFTGM